jgi:hypothetical protein
MITPKAGGGAKTLIGTVVFWLVVHTPTCHRDDPEFSHKSEEVEACLRSAMHDRTKLLSVTYLCQGNPNAGQQPLCGIEQP